MYLIVNSTQRCVKIFTFGCPAVTAWHGQVHQWSFIGRWSERRRSIPAFPGRNSRRIRRTRRLVAEIVPAYRCRIS